ncbi:MAG: glycogen synthase GlgA [Candidatus Omnitrophica bacterium]|nr:glycogen synthase GlgA [Candidatus Omnitrophota bacterium]
MARLGHEVRVVLPRYRLVDVKKWKLAKALKPWSLPVGPSTRTVGMWEGRMPEADIPTYFVEQPQLFDRDGLYQDKGVDFPDNLERFSVLTQAALSAVEQLKWQPDVVHAHDWQAALALPHLALRGPTSRFWQSAGRVFTVHNLAYQGLFPAEAWPLTGLPPQAFGIEGLEFYGQLNCLKGGLVYADVITTVSPTYAQEIQTAEFGCGLEGVLASRRSDVTGILNGIDPDEWNPKTDAHLAARYWSREPAGKGLCKLALQRAQQLPERHDLLIGMIQRLAEQKGIDIFAQAAEDLMRLPLQIVILGTGDPVYHEKLTALAARYPKKLALNLRFDNPLAHQIEAGADAFLMPSRFEPCGLNQMYSMRFGTVPIVRRVGGLADTVVDLSPAARQIATGFVFQDYSAEALLAAVTRALAAFQDHDLWAGLMRHGMTQDFSWERSARAYVEVYERALARHAAAPARRLPAPGPARQAGNPSPTAASAR